MTRTIAVSQTPPPPAAPVPTGHCVVLVVRDPMALRNYFRPDIVATLARSGHRFVVLAPDPDAPYLTERFADASFTFARLEPPSVVREKWRRLALFLRLVRQYTYPGAPLGEMETRRHQIDYYRREGVGPDGSWRARFFYGAMPFFGGLASRWAWLRSTLFAIERRLFPLDGYRALFARERPSLVVLGSYGYGYDWQLMLAAREAGARTLGIVRSWDNPTTKGWGCVLPDRVLTWSRVMSDEMVRLHAVPRERIHEVGVPHWDGYFEPATGQTREPFFARYGLDPTRRTIYFATGSPNMFLHNMSITRDILEAIRDGRISGDGPGTVQLIVRLHPEFAIASKERYRVHADECRAELERLAEEFAGMFGVSHNAIERLGTLTLVRDENQDELKALFTHCDMMVTIYSTQMLEAAVFDLPIVNAAYYPFRTLEMASSICRHFDHIRRVLATGAVTDCYDRDALVAAINDALANPARLAAERRRLVDQELDTNRGHAGQTIARHIVELAGGAA